ncbi:MAG: hypothetical protein AAF337_07500 [Pseudomonadota bacterium]
MKKLVLLASIFALASASSLQAQEADSKEAELDRTPRNCLPIVQLRRSHVIDDENIVFELRGRDYFLSQLPNRCPRLGFERSFSYATSITQLCNVDIITVLQNFGGRISPGPSCGLGMFVPITRDEFKALRKGEEVAIDGIEKKEGR